MNESIQSPLNSHGWDTLKFKIDNHLIEVPNIKMIQELMYVPILDKIFIENIIGEYGILDGTKIKIRKILSQHHSETFWEDIMDIVYEDRNKDDLYKKIYHQLYVMLSLQTYRVARSSQLHDEEFSLTLQAISNRAIAKIHDNLTHLSESDLISKKFCAMKSFNYETIQYYESVIKYMWNMLPLPLNCIQNLDRDDSWSNFKHSKFDEQMAFPAQDILPLNKDGSTDINLEKYNKRRQESERRMCSLFTNYRNAKKQISQFSILLLEEFPDFVHKWLDRNDITTIHNRSQQRIDKKQRQQSTILSRCEFCYKFWLMERKRGNNEP
jgi:hypothetical protein